MVKKAYLILILSLFQILNAYYKIPYTNQEKEWLQKHHNIKIAPDPKFHPIEYFDKDGSYKGISADFMKIIEKELGVEFEVVHCKNWDEVIEKAKNREIDLLPAAAQSPEREKFLSFSIPYIIFPGVIITKKTNNSLKNIGDLKNKKVGIVSGYVWEEFVRRDYTKINIVPVNDVSEELKKLSNKEIDAAIVSLPNFLYFARKDGYIDLKIAGQSGYYTKLSILSRNDWPIFNNIIDKTLQNIPEEQKQKIRDKWLMGYNNQSKKIKNLVKIIIILFSISILIILLISFWNKRLQKIVKEKTKELNNEMKLLKEKEKENYRLNQFQKNIIENSKFWISVFDKNGKVLIWNRAAELITGYSKKEAFSPNAPQLKFYENGEIKYSNDVVKFIFENEIIYDNKESKILTKNNETKTISSFSRIIRDKNNNKTALMIIVQDITKQKNYEIKIQKSLKFLNFLNELSASLSYSYDLLEISKNSVKKIREYFPNTFVIIFLKSKEEGFLDSYYWEGENPGSWDKSVKLSINDSLTGKSFLEQKIEYLTDFQNNNNKKINVSIVKNLYEHNYRTSIIIPLIYNNESFGTINITSEEKNFLSGENDRLMALGKTIAISLKNAMYVEKINKQLQIIKNTKTKLKKTNETYEKLLKFNPYGILIHDKGIVKYCNDAIVKILELDSKEDLIGKSIFPYIHPDYRQIVLQRIKQVSQEDSFIEPIEEKFISKKQNIRWLEISGFNISNNEKLVMVHNITQRKKSEKEKKEISKYLIEKEKMDAVGLLAGGIAHDFNNFLTVINGTIDILSLMTKNKEKAQNILFTAAKATEKAKNLTQQLLTFSKGGKPIKQTSSLIEVVKDTTKFILSGTKIKPEFDIQENLWLSNIDKGQISQVIQNIVLNARQVMPGGGIIKISLKNVNKNLLKKYHFKENNYIEISIKDEGPGIPRKNIDKIFTPYFTTKKEGNGIGLSVCYSIIKKHNGYIFVDSKEYFGTAFKIYLPAIVDKKNELQKNYSNNNEEFSGKILLMDDEEMILKIGKEMLNLIGFDVQFAKNGEEAIQYYKKSFEEKSPFDLVILDLTVPGNKGGKEAMEELLKIDKDVKGIVCSGYSNSPILADFKEYGFKAAIMKPYTLDKLINVIKNVLKNNMEI